MNALGISCLVLALVCVHLAYGLYTAPACTHTQFPTDIQPGETEVQLNNCPFSEIYPGEMAYLYALTDLGFFDNPLIVNFPNLTDVAGTLINLRISNCGLTYIPPELLSPLVNLQKLGVQRNQITNLPILPELPQMGFLPFRENQLTEVPVLTAWPLLQFVDMSAMPITSVDPDSFAGLKQLLTVKLEYITGTFTELPRFDAPQSQFTKLYLTGSSIALMPAVTTAVLGTLTLLKAVDTAQLEFLPTLCTRDPPSLSIDVTGSGLKLCDCRHAWLKAAMEAGATVTAATTTCWGQDWASMTAAHFLSNCEQPKESSMREFTATTRPVPVYCAFPRGVIYTDIVPFRCIALCRSTKGCLSVNFKPTGDGGVGECVLLAPTLEGVYEQAADQEGWVLYGLSF